MSVSHQSETVIVGAIFGSGSRMRPAWFHAGGRKVRIVGVHYTWSERRGRTVLYHFSVTDGTDTFHLVMNGEELTWRLEGTHLSP